MSGPLVSCIMPTRDRRPFVAQAVRYFMRQDYPARELIVVDDGEQELAALLPDDPRIRYLSLPPGQSIGTKRNHACAQARGDVVVHWDDDDWMAPGRIRCQVESLLAGDADVVGSSTLLYHDARSGETWEYSYQGVRPWVHDGTFCYRRELWSANPFPDAGRAVGTDFLWTGRPKRVQPLPDGTYYVAIVHAGNDSPKSPTNRWWRPVPSSEVEVLLGEDRRFYHRLSRRGGSYPPPVTSFIHRR